VPDRSDPKPEKRYVAHQREWKELRKQVLAGGKCAVGDCAVPATDCHHAIPRSLRGSDVRLNLVPLCHPHHMQYEDRDLGWEEVAGKIREGMTPEQVEYVVSKKSLEFLDRYYPLRKGC